MHYRLITIKLHTNEQLAEDTLTIRLFPHYKSKEVF